jgi:small conductance mechanosensitive channel
MNHIRSGILFDLTATLTSWLGYFGIELETARQYGVRILIIWLLAMAAWFAISLVAARIVAAADDGDDASLTYHEKRAHTVSGLLRGAGKIVILIFALILTLDVFLDIGPLLAGAGVIGLAVSFGSQSLVKDMLSGFFILSENQFDIGDVIEVAGKTGAVERITMRVVHLRDLEGIVHIVPNGQITTVSNKTRGWSRAVVDIGVGYGSDIDQALEVLRDEAEQFGADRAWRIKLDGDPEVLGVQLLGDSAVTLRVMLRTQPGLQWEVGREFRRRAKLRLDREGIEIPFPQRTVHVRRHGDSDDGALPAEAS